MTVRLACVVEVPTVIFINLNSVLVVVPMEPRLPLTLDEVLVVFVKHLLKQPTGWAGPAAFALAVAEAGRSSLNITLA
jgi:hypothetical protein